MAQRDSYYSSSSASSSSDLNALLGRGSEFEGKLAFEGKVRIDGTFTGVGVISGNGGGGDPFDAVVADFNNDGILDVAGPVERGIDPIHFYEVNDGFAVYTGKPGGRSFNDPVYFSVSSTASTARMIDTGFFTHQGKKDVLLTEDFTAAIDTFWNTTSRLGDPCPYPINIGVTFCSPATGATLASPVRFRASAHVATQPANRIELWIDGHKRFQTFSDLLDRKIALASGTHTVTVISVDAAGKLIKKSIAIRVP